MMVGCSHVRGDPHDPRFAGLSHFISVHGKTKSYGGDVISEMMVTRLDARGMSFVSSSHKLGRNDVSKYETTFNWPQIEFAVIRISEYGSSLLLALRSAGVSRFRDSQQGFWRRGPVKSVGFAFQTTDQALRFYRLFVAIAQDHGAKFSRPLKIRDDRNPTPLSPAAKARLENLMKRVRANPGWFDRTFPRER